MLSVENLADPSCSSKPLAVIKADERASQSLAFQEADPVLLEETPTPNFCIRDYVYASRSKSIEASWPFGRGSLKLCLKHGIKDILPPFESPSLVRSNCLEKFAQTEQPIAFLAVEENNQNLDLSEQRDIDPFNVKFDTSRLESCILLEEVAIDCLDPDSQSSLNDWKSAVRQGTSLYKPVNSSPSEIEITEPSLKPQNCNKLLEKKCKSTNKLGISLEASHVEDVISNSSTISDTMASKICPVCKRFSSTSNTTLNAHIDQCLSMESSAKKVISEFPRVKVKPRKKRLLIDVYATAEHFTLEDLDRRNGTNWATELKLLVTPNKEVVNDNKAERKRPRLSTNVAFPQIKSSNEAKGDETDGPVYVDSKGIKLRILTKFSDTSLRSEEIKPKKHESMIGKSIVIAKRKHPATKYLRNLKEKTCKGKLCSFRPLKSQIQTTSKGDFDAENDEKSEKSISRTSDEHDQNGNGRFPVLSRWVCPKRSNVLQKVTKEDVSCTMNMVPASTDVPLKRSLIGPCSSSLERRRHKKFSRSSSGSLKTKRVDLLCNLVHNVAGEKRMSVESSIPSSRWGRVSSTSPNGLVLKLSRSSRNLRSSSKGKLDSDKDIHRMSDDLSDMSMRPFGSFMSLVQDPTDMAVNKNKSKFLEYLDLEQRRVKESERHPASKKFWKHRSKLRSTRRGAAIHASSEGGVSGPSKNIDLDVHKEGIALSSGESAQLMASTSSRIDAEETMDQTSPGRRPKCSETTKEQKHHQQNQLHRGSESQEETIDAMHWPAKIMESVIFSVEISDEQAAHNHIDGGAVAGESTKQSSETVRFPYLCTEENAFSRTASEAYVEQWQRKSENGKPVNADISCEAMGTTDNQIIDEVEVGGTQGYCIEPIGECHADRASPQESDGCLTNHGDVEVEIPHKATSITSIHVPSNGNKTKATVQELSVSPISTASSISLPLSPEGTESKNSDAELFTKLMNPQYKSWVPVSCEESNGITEKEEFERRNHQVKDNPIEVEPKQIFDDEPLCCSCKESLSKASQSSRQDPTSLRAKGQRVPNLLLVPRVTSSFSAYQNRMASTSMELPSHTGFPVYSHDTAMKYSSCADLGSPSPSSQSNVMSTSSPVLRLMGKNLMVMANEEPVQPQTRLSEYSPSLSVLSHGFASTNNLLHPESSPYHHHQQHQHNPPHHHFNHHHWQQQQIFSSFPASSAEATSFGSHQRSLQLPVPPTEGFIRSPFHTYWVAQPDQCTHQKGPSQRPESSKAPHMMNEVIVSDKSPEESSELEGLLANQISILPRSSSGLVSLPPLPVPGYPLPTQLPEVPGAQRALVQHYYLGSHASFANQSSYSAGPGSILPNQFIFQSSSSGQVRPTMYYSNILR